jgi:hypothetical protein
MASLRCLRFALGKYEVAEVSLRWFRFTLVGFKVTEVSLRYARGSLGYELDKMGPK